MRALNVSAVVDLPREQVFDYLSDIANHAEFTDHYVDEFRLERLQSSGLGAAARYRIRFPLGRIWAECVIAEVDRPYLVRLDHLEAAF